jgi:arsenate reductase
MVVMSKPKVLLLCTGNACRSQMAEGLVRDRLGDFLDVHSAGIHPAGVHPYASRVLREIGIDSSEQYSKHVTELFHVEFDLVVTLCNHADSFCPDFHNARDRTHLPFVDPIYATGTEEEVVGAFRASRDDIDRRLVPFLRKHFQIEEPS